MSNCIGSVPGLKCDANLQSLRWCRMTYAYVLGCRLRVEVKIKSTGEWSWAEYDNMTVESESNKYTLHVTGYHGNAGDAFNNDHSEAWQSNGMPFSTLDVDNDQNPNGNCAIIFSGGWWFRWCSTSCVNRLHAYWYSAAQPIPVSASRMMLQRGAG